MVDVVLEDHCLQVVVGLVLEECGVLLAAHEARLGVEGLAEPVAVAAEVVRDKVRVDAAAEAEDAVAHPVAALLQPDVSAMFDNLC